MSEVTLPPGWLKRSLDDAAREVAKWPKWQQEAARRWVESLRPQPDPCVCPARCDTAQTCVGGCVYRKREEAGDE